MSNPFRQPAGRPMVYGHRGARGVLPENTMASFDYLRAIGVRAVEIDVQTTADGVPVVIHDPQVPMQLARDGAGHWLDAPGPKISDTSLKDLLAYDVGRLNPAHAYGTRYPHQRPVDGAQVPVLSQFLEWAAQDPDFLINIEIKSFPDDDHLGNAPRVLAQAVIDAVARHGVARNCLISSFDWRVLSAVRALAPDMARGYLSYQQNDEDCTIFNDSPWMDGLRLSGDTPDLPRLIAAQGAQCWCPYYRDLTPQQLSKAHDLGLAVNVWTVNEPSDMAAMVDMGVDGVITDYPDRMTALLGRGAIRTAAAK